MTKTNHPLFDRLIISIAAAITGGLYGVILWGVAYYFTHSYHPSLIVLSISIFWVLGLFFGNFILEAFLALLHFFWGMLCGMDVFRIFEPSTGSTTGVDKDSPKHLKAFVLVGFATGLIIYNWHVWL
jgi:hypothetical protein